MTGSDLSGSEPQMLSRLIGVGDRSSHDWQHDELASIMRHQLDADLVGELGGADIRTRHRVADMQPHDRPRLTTIRDLLCASNPPIELLILAKEYARSFHSHPESPLPPPIATMLYYTCIVVALVRLDRRITKLDDASLTHGIEWALGQEWLDEPLRGLFREGLSIVKGG